MGIDISVLRGTIATRVATVLDTCQPHVSTRTCIHVHAHVYTHVHTVCTLSTHMPMHRSIHMSTHKSTHMSAQSNSPVLKQDAIGRVCTLVHVHIYLWLCVCVCMSAPMLVHGLQTCPYTTQMSRCMFELIPMPMSTHMSIHCTLVYAHVCVHVYTHVYTHVYALHTCLRACLYSCLYKYPHTCLYTTPISMHVYTHGSF